MIPLKDVLAKMGEVDKGGNAIPFSIEYVTHDKKRKTGGVVKFYPEAILCFQTKSKGGVKAVVETDYKKPKHSQNETRNIEILNCGVLTSTRRKVNILLITKFNNEDVT